MSEQERFFQVGIFFIREHWTPLPSRQGDDIRHPQAKNGKYTIQVGRREKEGLGMEIVYAEASAYDLGTAREKVVAEYRQSIHGMNGLKSYQSCLGEYVSGKIEPLRL